MARGSAGARASTGGATLAAGAVAIFGNGLPGAAAAFLASSVGSAALASLAWSATDIFKASSIADIAAATAS
jgi:hypothetical protein